jgi:uncharacterized protein YndB with AHSA1/START domain
MPLTDVPVLEESIEIAAPPARVWELVRDPRQMTRWSPQTWKSVLRGGGEPGHGSRFVNVNRKGLLVWPTRSKIVRFEPEREIAWRVKDNYTVWSLHLEPIPTGSGEGTRLVQRREAPEGIAEISVRLVNIAMGGQERFTDDLRAGMRDTLLQIKADAER